MKIIYFIALLLVPVQLAVAATNDITSLVQKGLFEEEANHNLEVAMQHYQTAIGSFDQDRKLIATAVFRLGECYRKQGKTNEATVQYHRILQEFSDQTELAKLSAEYGGGIKSTVQNKPDKKKEDLHSQWELLKFQETTARRLYDRATKFNSDEKVNYFTTIERDAIVEKWVSDLAAYEVLFIQATNNYGPKSPEYQAANATLNGLKSQIEKRVQALIWGLGQNADALTDQRTAVEDQLQQAMSAEAKKSAFAHFQSPAQPEPTPTATSEDEEIRKIKAMIQNSPDLINATGGVGPAGFGNRTPLGNAAINGMLQVASYLITNGADINLGGTPPLLDAAFYGNKAMVELLLSNGAKVNATSASGETALDAAAGRGFRSVVEVLLTHGADVNASQHGFTPLHRAASNANKETVQMLLDHGADVNAMGDGGYTPLHEAVRRNPEVIQLLIDHKALINATNQNGFTPLLFAVSSNKIDLNTVKILLANGANTEAQVADDYNDAQTRGFRAINYAIRYDRLELLQLLLANHANPNATFKSYSIYSSEQKWRDGITPLIMVISERKPHAAELAEYLLDHGADPNLADAKGWTPLHHAVTSKNKKLVEVLIARHINVNVRDRDGMPPMAYAQPPSDIADLLDKVGADKNYLRRKNISFSFKGGETVCFYQTTNDWNRYTVLELLASRYNRGRPVLHPGTAGPYDGHPGPDFPDFSRVLIHRLEPDGKTNEIKVDALALLQDASKKKDVLLQWGDIIELPERDHPISEKWEGLPKLIVQGLRQCLARTVEVTIKSQSTNFTVWAPLDENYLELAFDPQRKATMWEVNKSGFSPDKPGIIVSSFRINPVLQTARILLASSDLTRVKVKHRDSAEETIVDLTKSFNGNNYNEANDLWLKDGDKIEIPERN